MKSFAIAALAAGILLIAQPVFAQSTDTKSNDIYVLGAAMIEGLAAQRALVCTRQPDPRLCNGEFALAVLTLTETHSSMLRLETVLVGDEKASEEARDKIEMGFVQLRGQFEELRKK